MHALNRFLLLAGRYVSPCNVPSVATVASVAMGSGLEVENIENEKFIYYRKPRPHHNARYVATVATVATVAATHIHIPGSIAQTLPTNRGDHCYA